jgi:hypothetical protein
MVQLSIPIPSKNALLNTGQLRFKGKLPQNVPPADGAS